MLNPITIITLNVNAPIKKQKDYQTELSYFLFQENKE